MDVWCGVVASAAACASNVLAVRSMWLYCWPKLIKLTNHLCCCRFSCHHLNQMDDLPFVHSKRYETTHNTHTLSSVWNAFVRINEHTMLSFIWNYSLVFDKCLHRIASLLGYWRGYFSAGSPRWFRTVLRPLLCVCARQVYSRNKSDCPNAPGGALPNPVVNMNKLLCIYVCSIAAVLPPSPPPSLLRQVMFPPISKHWTQNA